jgi:uncharacterized Zn ribbon protein
MGKLIQIGMDTFKIIPQLRENCVIYGEKENLAKFSEGDSIFLISDLPHKRYSIISKIEKIIHASERKILIDERNSEKLTRGDRVMVIKYNPIEALKVNIAVKEDNTLIAKGNWTSVIRPLLKKKTIDSGQEISFLIPWEEKAPIIGHGIINSTIPAPPTYIGDDTEITISKVSKEKIQQIKKKNFEVHEKRVEILREQINKNYIDEIRKIKQNNYPTMGIRYNFNIVNVRKLFRSILHIFKGLTVLEEPEEHSFNQDAQDYLANIVLLKNSDLKNLQIIDIQIIYSKTSGSLIIWYTGKSKADILETSKKYHIKIRQIKEILEDQVEVVNLECPECGGTLPIDEISLNGLVKCEYCEMVSIIPKVLRY